MGGRRVEPGRLERLAGLLDAGMNPNRAARAAGVSKTLAYRVDRERSGGPGRLAAQRAAVAGRDAERAGRAQAARGAGAGGAGPGRVRAEPEPGGADGRRVEVVRVRLDKKMGGVRTVLSPSSTARVTSAARNATRSPGCARRAFPSARSRPGWAARRRRSAGSWPATPPRAAAATSPSWRTRWPGPPAAPQASKLSRNPALRAAVQGMLERRYSPEQASGRLKAMHPGDPSMHVSHETIYQSIYVYPRGELKRELRACLRSGRALRKPRGRREARGKIIGAVPLGQRPRRPRAGWCPATTRATWSWAQRRPTPRSRRSWSG